MPRESAEQPVEAGVRTAIPALSEPIATPAPFKPDAKRPAARKSAPKKPAVAPPAASVSETATPGPDAAPAPSDGELEAVIGRVKWVDATRGFGFLVSDQLDGDILLHFSVLRDHGR